MAQQRGAGPAQPLHYLAAWGCREDWQRTCYELVQRGDSDSIPSGPRVVALAGELLDGLGGFLANFSRALIRGAEKR
jgi:hypothetical protein